LEAVTDNRTNLPETFKLTDVLILNDCCDNLSYFK